MATLADSFLQDLEDLDDAVGRSTEPVTVPGMEEAKEQAKEEDSMRSTMLMNTEFTDLMDDVRRRKDDTTLEAGKQLTEDHEEYKLIVRCNSLVKEIDEEIFLLHGKVRGKYVDRFPELDSIVYGPLEYLQTVQRLGNAEDITVLDFSDFLPNQVIMAMTVTFSMSTGTLLDEELLEQCLLGCEDAFTLNDCKRDVLLYLESRMSGLAPNLSALLGASLAAKLVTAAGGLLNLARMPAQNIMLVGSLKKNLMGMSGAGAHNTGIVMTSDIIVGTPPEFRNRAIKLVSGKTGLAARVDSFRESPLGQVGTQLREQILQALIKAQEPPPAKQKKPLPVPVEKIGKTKRGGKRWRAQKEKYGPTEFSKSLNRMTFGAKEDDMNDQSESGMGFGQLSKAAGMGRAGTSGSKRAMDKKMDSIKRQRMAAAAGARESGMSSSLAFTPVQGIELCNPQASFVKKATENAEKYFADSTAFRNVKK